MCGRLQEHADISLPRRISANAASTIEPWSAHEEIYFENPTHSGGRGDVRRGCEGGPDLARCCAGFGNLEVRGNGNQKPARRYAAHRERYTAYSQRVPAGCLSRERNCNNHLPGRRLSVAFH